MYMGRLTKDAEIWPYSGRLAKKGGREKFLLVQNFGHTESVILSHHMPLQLNVYGQAQCLEQA